MLRATASPLISSLPAFSKLTGFSFSFFVKNMIAMMGLALGIDRLRLSNAGERLLMPAHGGKIFRIPLMTGRVIRIQLERARPVLHGVESLTPLVVDVAEFGIHVVAKIGVEPNGALGGAIEYFLTHWNGLTQFLRVAGAPLSNAEVERLLKKCVLRRKNSMFYKTQVGAWIGDIQSATSGTPTLFFVQALEPSDVLTIDLPSFEKLRVDS